MASLLGCRLNIRRSNVRRRSLRLAAVILTSLWSLPLVSGCSPELDTHGELIEPGRLAQLQPGVHRKDDVAQLLGSPSSTAVFDDEIWYYIADVVEQYSIFERNIKQRQVLALHFDENGVLQSLDEHGVDQGRKIDIVERETPSFGESPNIIQQVIGNLGRFNKDETQAPRR